MSRTEPEPVAASPNRMSRARQSQLIQGFADSLEQAEQAAQQQLLPQPQPLPPGRPHGSRLTSSRLSSSALSSPASPLESAPPSDRSGSSGSSDVQLDLLIRKTELLASDMQDNINTYEQMNDNANPTGAEVSVGILPRTPMHALGPFHVL